MTPVYERYADALFSASEALACTDVIVGEFLAMDELLGQFGGYLNDPLISTGTKITIFRELLTGEISQLMLEFILIMTYHRHLKHFHKAALHFQQLSGFGKAVVRLRVPFKPDQDILGQLESRLIEARLIPEGAKETEFHVIEDEGLIGGLIASCNGYQIDTSLKTVLQKLKVR